MYFCTQNKTVITINKEKYTALYLFSTMTTKSIIDSSAATKVAATDHTVVITVPHIICGVPYAANTHECDFSAGSAALMLARKFQANNDKRNRDDPRIKTISVKGDIARAYVDLNRRPSRTASGTTMRKRLTAIMKNLSPSSDIVLDIHSYPPDYTKWVGTEMSILDSDWRTSTLGTELFAMLKEAGVIIVYNQTGLVNDIMDEAIYDHNIPAVLLEFNEGNNNKTSNRIMDLVVNSVVKYLSQ